MINSTAQKVLFACILLLPHAAQSAQFSIVVIPDTQWYAENNSPIFQAQTQWIKANRVNENIIYVAHLGDLKDGAGGSGCDNKNLGGGLTEWGYVDQALDVLETPSIDPLATGLTDGIPYGTVPGNHDFDGLGGGGNGGPCPSYDADDATGRDLSLFDNRLGDGHFNTFGYYGGTRLPNTAQETGLGATDPTGDSYTLFDYCGIEFIAINLGFREDPEGGAPIATVNPEMQWANNLLASNPNRLGIVTSHFLLLTNSGGDNNDFGAWPGALYGELSANPNLFLMMSAHERGEAWRTETLGRGGLEPVQVLMSNYQRIEYDATPNFNNLNEAGGGQGDSGLMRIMRFDTNMGTVSVETFSPEVSALGRPKLTSGVTANSGNDMDETTGSIFEFSFQNYGTTSSSCSTEPVDVTLTMDRSGSMNANSALGGTKIAAVKNAADLFVDQIALDGVHRLGLTHFNTADVPFPMPFEFDRLNAVNAVGAKATIASMVAGGGTDIIDGLDAGAAELDVAIPNDRQAVVLFTDGKHNSPGVLSNNDLRDALNASVNAVSGSMELYSIGFGTSINDVPLGEAANLNDGWHVNEVDSMAMMKDFSLVAADVMNDVTLIDPIYHLKAGETQVQKIGVSQEDDNLTFVVHWDNFDADRVKTNVVPPGGSCSISSDIVNPAAPQASGINYRMVRVNLPHDCNGTREHAGVWQISITASDRVRKTERVNVLAYASSAISLESRLKLTNRRLDIAASLLGDSLQNAKFTAYILTPLPETNDSTSHDTMGSDPGQVGSIPPLTLFPRSPIAIDLKVTDTKPTNIDAKGQFDARQQGLYQVRVVAELVDKHGQDVTRERVGTFYYEKPKGPRPIIWVLIAFVVVLLIFVLWNRKRKTV